jgi:2-haloacid dehalogenase
MATLRPKFITFDCYGTLTRFRMSDMTRTMFADRIAPDRMDAFVRDFAGYRVDEVLGAWKPYAEVIADAIRRTCKRWKIPVTPEEARAFYDAVPTWGPHADVPAPLKRVAEKIPLVILSNASDDQIMHNVRLLEAPFHMVLTAQQAKAYKPRLPAFEYMIDSLGCDPSELLHVSASLRYDLMSARDIGIRDTVYVNRGYEPSTPFYISHEIPDIAGLPGLVGL